MMVKLQTELVTSALAHGLVVDVGTVLEAWVHTLTANSTTRRGVI